VCVVHERKNFFTVEHWANQQSVAADDHSKPVSCQTAQRSTRYLLFQSRISRTPYPPIGGARCHRGPKIQSRYHLAPQRKLRCWESFESSKVAYAVGPLWKQGTLHITVAKRGPRQVPRLPSPKHTTVYNPDKWNRLNTFCFIQYAYFLTWCAHVNTVMSSYPDIIEHIEVADEFITSENTHFTWFFIIKSRNTGRLRKQIWVEKNLSGSPGHMRQNAYYRNLKWTSEDLLPCYCYTIKTKSTTTR